jgi:pSer/pThr/pTyr-binding forkhead associated (FHA) protein
MTVCPFCRKSVLEPAGGGYTYEPFDRTGDGDMEPKTTVPARSAGTTKIGPTRAPILAWLVVKSGPGAGTTFNLEDDTEIGRDGRCQIRLNDDFVSRSHARVKLEDGNFIIYDLGAKGGTFVNDRKVQRLLLRDGATIRLGQTMLEFKKTATAR